MTADGTSGAKIEIRRAETADVSAVARLHKERIKEGFLSSLGEIFLEMVYGNFIASPHGILIVARDGENFAGYVSGVTSVRGFYADFLKHHFFQASFYVLKKFLRFSTLKKVMETLFYPQKTREQDIPHAELLSIALDKRYTGRGIARKLFDALTEEFKGKNVKVFKVIVGAGLKDALKFYENAGCKKHSEIEIHKGEKSFIYVYNAR